MTTTPEKTSKESTELLTQFESEIVSSTQLPFCQIQNPLNLSLAQIQEFNPPWGWFIPQEQVQLAQFSSLGDDWQPTQLSFGAENNPRLVDGFLAQKLRLVVLHRSSIEVQEKVETGWRFCGLAYRAGQPTHFKELASRDREKYRLRTRYLVLFLDDQNKPLHSTPIKIGMNSGVGAAFGVELKEFRQEIETVFFSQLGKPQQQLSDRAHALTVFDFQLGLFKSDGKAPYIYPQIRSSPQTKTINVSRRDRPVTLKSQPLESLIVPKQSDTGKTILSLWQEHKGFSDQYRDDTASVGAPF